MTGAELAAEVKVILEEDGSLNEIWTTSQLHEFTKQAFPELSAKGMLYDKVFSVSVSSSGTTAPLKGHVVGVHTVHTPTGELELAEFSLGDLLSGTTNPLTTGTPEAASLEHDTGSSGQDKVLRFMPGFSSSGTTLRVLSVSGASAPASSASDLGASEVFLLALKLSVCARAFAMDSLRADPAKARFFQTLVDVLTGAFRGLYRGKV